MIQRLSVKALAVGFGISWSICILLAGWVSIFGWCVEFVEVMSSIYIGFKSSFVGGIIGAIWAFVDGAVAGAIIAFVYNTIAKRQ
jgi:hypothetical protein